MSSGGLKGFTSKGASLQDQVVYRIEFTNRLIPDGLPGPNDIRGGANELFWQLTGGSETMKVSFDLKLLS